MNHVMIDLETLGTRPGDTILSIGAVKFDHTGLGEEIHLTIDAESCKAVGLRAQKSTLEWWAKQSPEARKAAFSGELSLEAALLKLTMWMPPLDIAVVWGNGANFDNALLAAAYRAQKLDTPWQFWNDRCYRTVMNLFPQAKAARVGTHHNALDDAKTQALRLIEVTTANKITLK